MTSFKTVDEVNFEFAGVLTWGVKKDKHFGYSVPITVSDPNAKELITLSDKYKTESPVYGAYNTIYLKTNNLSPKQKSDLLDKGRCHIDTNIKLTGVNTPRNGKCYLLFKITKLRKSEKTEEDEECPED